MNWLLTLYIATTIFGVGVKIVDIFGLFGDDDDDDGNGFDEDVDGGQGEESGADFENGADDIGQDAGTSDAEGDSDSIIYREKSKAGDRIVTFISILRYTVYFCLGFGPVGLFYVLTYEKSLTSLYYSLSMGIVVVIIVKIVRKILIKELDSHFSDKEFIMEKAVVIVTIGKNSMGRIRINYAGSYQDRYARNINGDQVIPKNTNVRIVDLTDECFIVEAE